MQGLTWWPDTVAKKKKRGSFSNTILSVPLQPRSPRLQNYEALCFQSCIIMFMQLTKCVINHISHGSFEKTQVEVT